MTDTLVARDETGSGPANSPPSTDSIFKNKLVIRRLPAMMTEEEFFRAVEPWINSETCAFKYFVPGHISRGDTKDPKPSTAYAGFNTRDALIAFGQQHITIEAFGDEAIVEYAPYQAPLETNRKKDELSGTIIDNAVFKSFVARLKDPSLEPVPLVAPKPKARGQLPNGSKDGQPSTRKPSKKKSADADSGSSTGKKSRKSASQKASKKKGAKDTGEKAAEKSENGDTAAASRKKGAQSKKANRRPKQSSTKQSAISAEQAHTGASTAKHPTRSESSTTVSVSDDQAQQLQSTKPKRVRRKP
jgi:hypothetical protein